MPHLSDLGKCKHHLENKITQVEVLTGPSVCMVDDPYREVARLRYEAVNGMNSDSPNESQFARLYRATLHPLRRYLTRLLGNDAEAQDVAHDAYMRVYPKIWVRQCWPHHQ